MIRAMKYTLKVKLKFDAFDDAAARLLSEQLQNAYFSGLASKGLIESSLIRDGDRSGRNIICRNEDGTGNSSKC